MNTAILLARQRCAASATTLWRREASSNPSSVPTASSKSSRARTGSPGGSEASRGGRYDLIEKIISSSPNEVPVATSQAFSFNEEEDETIARAWMIHRQAARERSADRVKKAAEAQWKALDRLKEIRPLLYQVAVSRGSSAGELILNKVENGKMADKNKAAGSLGSAVHTGIRVGGVFPIDLKIPTETPSRKGWNYDWKP